VLHVGSQRFGRILVPQRTTVPRSSVAPANVSQPLQITYRCAYPESPTAESMKAADADATKKVAALAQRLAQRLHKAPAQTTRLPTRWVSTNRPRPAGQGRAIGVSPCGAHCASGQPAALVSTSTALEGDGVGGR